MDRMFGLAEAHRRCTSPYCCDEDAERAIGRAAKESGANANRTTLHFSRTILRNVQGVCTVVTHPYYNDGKWAYTKEKGGPSIPISTGLELRVLAGVEPNVSFRGSLVAMGEMLQRAAPATALCEGMLGATPCGRRSVGVPCGWNEKF